MAAKAEAKGGITVAKPPEGEMMAVVKNNPDGPLDLFVMSLEGYHFRYQEYSNDPNDVHELNEVDKWDVLPNRGPKGEIYFSPPKGDILEEELALIFVGPSRALKVPKIKYVKWEKKEGTTKFGVESKDRTDSPYFFFQYSMAIPAVDVEVEGNTFTVTIVVNIVLRITNPYKALFLAGGFESTIEGAVLGAIREYVGPKKVQDLRAETEMGAKGLTAWILNLNKDAPGIQAPEEIQHAVDHQAGVEAKFGILLVDVRFLQFDITSKDQKVRDALGAKEINRLLAEAAVHKAAEIKTIGDAKAGAAKQLAEAFGSGAAAAQVQQSENYGDAIRETNASTVVIGGSGNTPPISIPGDGRPRRNKKPRDKK